MLTSGTFPSIKDGRGSKNRSSVQQKLSSISYPSPQALSGTPAVSKNALECFLDKDSVPWSLNTWLGVAKWTKERLEI